jgi:hypothetical protein
MNISSFPTREAGGLLIRFRLFVHSYSTERNEGRNLNLSLNDPGQTCILSRNLPLDSPISYGQRTEMIIDHVIEEPRLWTPEFPRLYKLKIGMSGAEGSQAEVLTTRFALRNLILTDSLYLLNGDTLQPDPLRTLDASAIMKLDSKEIREKTSSGDLRFIRTNEPLPCGMNLLLDELGVLRIPRD